ncbi:cytochrome C biogenesis protein transmembrane region [mine drainage metagenome]|uniref:Cytochrome C biogenesis protein transmembrane region n=1 Tax=mine drainage metagenome TaxID=410659 RepID=A0A1J5PK95_9ZZZZ
MTVGYVVAFLGGILTLASPCSAFLLPSFFAYAFPSKSQLLSRTLAFYIGLAVVLIPLGLGSGAASQLVYGHRQALFITAGAFLIALGIAQALGLGVRIPGLDRLRSHTAGTSKASVVVLGAASGLTGFCTGPILGAVLTVAATSGSPLRGGSLLAMYAAGMTAPLFALALLWQRLRLSDRRLLRGRPVRLGSRTLHSTSLIGGVLVSLVGVLFIVDRGGALTGGGFLSVDTEARLQNAVSRLGANSDLTALALIALIALIVLVLRLRAVRTKVESSNR